jgi:branched-chain amino acid aminotransferase
MRASMAAKAKGFTEVLFLDAKEKRYIDESGPANFFGITKEGQYVTPLSPSILPSITNKSLMTIAEDMGMNPLRRPIDVEEIFELEEAGCCGTAAVITPVGSITWGDRKVVYGDGETPQPRVTAMYERLQAIQCGAAEDVWGWVRVVPEE